jgi:hypothetical protein
LLPVRKLRRPDIRHRASVTLLVLAALLLLGAVLSLPV